MIDGVHIKKVVKHNDERGFFAELMKEGDAGFHTIAQTSYSVTEAGVIKGFHYHDYWESWAVLRGRALMVMHDTRSDSPTKGETQTLVAGEDDLTVLTIPPGVIHGYRALDGEAIGMLYQAEEAYDPSRKDQILTVAHDSPEVGFDWDASYE